MALCTQLTPAQSASLEDWSIFASAIDRVLGMLLPLSPSLKWPVFGASGLQIGLVSAADFGFKLANISWTLVDESFGGVNGGVGQVLSTFKGGDWQDPDDWLSAAEEINPRAFAAYLDLKGGLEYLILHETAHVTKFGIITNNMQFDQYVHGGGDRSDGAAWAASPQWLYNEQVANAIAHAVATALDLPFLDHPTCGFPGDPALGSPIRMAAVATGGAVAA